MKRQMHEIHNPQLDTVQHSMYTFDKSLIASIAAKLALKISFDSDSKVILPQKDIIGICAWRAAQHRLGSHSIHHRSTHIHTVRTV
jgi:hypothetical protein